MISIVLEIGDDSIRDSDENKHLLERTQAVRRVSFVLTLNPPTVTWFFIPVEKVDGHIQIFNPKAMRQGDLYMHPHHAFCHWPREPPVS